MLSKGHLSHRRIKLVHIPKGFANYLLVGSTPTKRTEAGEFAIEEGYAMPENLFSRISNIPASDIDNFS